MMIAADFSPDAQLVRRRPRRPRRDCPFQGAGLGDFAGSAAVQNLQQSLTGLFKAAGWPAVNPGPVTGDVTPQTVLAVGNVVSHLGGKLSSDVKTALQLGLVGASLSTTVMGAAKTLVAQYAAQIHPAVLALTAVYTKGSVPPTPPPAPIGLDRLKSMTAQQFLPLIPFKPEAQTPTLPSGSIQTRSKTGLFRVAVPAAQAAGLDGPSLAAAAFFELPARSAAADDAQFVSETEFDRQTGSTPFYKRPLYWAVLGGVVVAGGGAWYLLRG